MGSNLFALDPNLKMITNVQSFNHPVEEDLFSAVVETRPKEIETKGRTHQQTLGLGKAFQRIATAEETKTL